MKQKENLWILLVLAMLTGSALLMLAGCDDDDPTGPQDQQNTPTPISTFTETYQLTLEPRDDGLYCHDASNETLRIPWPMTLGQTFQGSIRNCMGAMELSVFSVDDHYTSGAGLFDGVIQVGKSLSYDSHYAYFKPQIGFLGYETVAGRSFTRRALSYYEASQGGDPIANRYGLMIGNRWIYAVRWSDSNGSQVMEGTETHVCSAKTSIAGNDAYVIDVTVELARYSYNAAERDRSIHPSDHRQRPVLDQRD